MTEGASLTHLVQVLVHHREALQVDAEPAGLFLLCQEDVPLAQEDVPQLVQVLEGLNAQLLGPPCAACTGAMSGDKVRTECSQLAKGRAESAPDMSFALSGTSSATWSWKNLHNGWLLVSVSSRLGHCSLGSAGRCASVVPYGVGSRLGLPAAARGLARA